MPQETTPTRAEARTRFQRTLARVLFVQLVAIVAIAALQIRYGL